jgi:hypothetical protein
MASRQRPSAIVIIALILLFMVNIPVFGGGASTWFSVDSGTTHDLTGIWGIDASHIFAVGKSGTVLFYNGSAWKQIESGVRTDLTCVWGLDAGDIFATGNSGTILLYDGSGWSSMDSGVSVDLYAIWGPDRSNIYAVGSAGTILHYDGDTWSSITGDVSNDLLCIWGASDSAIFAAGRSGTILYFDGDVWSQMDSGVSNDFYAIWGQTGSSVFAAGTAGTFLNYDGTSWAVTDNGITGDIYGIWATSGRDIFLVGRSGTIAHYDGSTLSPMNRDTINDLHSVWGLSSTNIFTVGREATMLRYLPPAISSISPGRGDQGETLDIVITGENLDGANEMRFGSGIAVNSFRTISAKSITANISITAGAAVGTRDVYIGTPGGNYSLPAAFTVSQLQPALAAISPDRDRQGATLTVTITGTNLTRTSDVRLGPGIAVNSFSVLSPNQITANISIAAGADTGARDVTLTTPVGNISLLSGFTVVQTLPTINSISPTQSNQGTGLTITVDGTYLNGASSVSLGEGITVSRFSILSANQITVDISLTADAAVGTRDLSVTTPGGSVTLPRCFTVKQALPTLVSVNPANGNQGATLDVTITGTNLSGASQLRLGTGIAVNTFTVLDSKTITAGITIVAGTETGLRDISVTTPGGSYTLANVFTIIQGLPVINSVSPESGSMGATLTVIISGSNLDGATAVSFGSGIRVRSFTNLSPTQLRVNISIAEEAATGTRDISVTTPGGSSTLGNSYNIQEKALGVFFIALIWVGIAVVIALFILLLYLLRRRRASIK